MKISQIKYVRPDKEKVLAELAEFKKRFENAQNVDEFMQINDEYKTYVEKMSTNFRIAFIRFTQDTRSEYAEEQDYLDEIGPEISVATSEIAMCYLTGKFRDQLEERFPPIMFKNLQMQVDASNPLIVEDQVEENKIVTSYTKLMSTVTVEFNGEKMTLSALRQFFTNDDREIRKQAYTKLGEALVANKDELDSIYDKLVKVRTKMGKKLGYEGYSPLGYLRMQRNCYTKEDIARFRANVKKYIVPLACKIRAKVGEDLQLGQQYIYDDGVFSKDEPKLIGGFEGMVKNAQIMFDEMSKETGDLYRTMTECECFDLLAREGKWGGGYCDGLPEYKLPFILGNFTQSADDFGTLTHEFGHAYEFYKSFFIESDFLSSISMETAEVHSMSMEFLVYPWLKLFFGDKSEQYKFLHIGGAVTFIPYGTIVDYFQQTCYDNPDMTPGERNEFFNKIEKEFLPYMTTQGIPGVEDGRRWQRQAHIYESPFYYIDYCFAQFTALQFLALSQKDYKATQEKYVKFLSYGGTMPFTELLKACDLLSPFEEESFKLVTDTIEGILQL